VIRSNSDGPKNSKQPASEETGSTLLLYLGSFDGMTDRLVSVNKLRSFGHGIHYGCSEGGWHPE
jgi:hypothetical protein